MLLEALEYLLTPASRLARRMGFLREQIAIKARFRRNREAWAPHLAATREAILDAASRCTGNRCALILGAGLHYDLPLEELSLRFDRVVLADLLHRPGPRRRAAALGPHILCVEFDVSGALETVFASNGKLSEDELFSRVRLAQPGLPAACGGEPDLVVSANLASQLMLLPCEWLERKQPRSQPFPARLAEAALHRHLDWLQDRRGVCALIAEEERLRVDRSGTITAREPIAGMQDMIAPDRTWTWRIAPIPELDPLHHVEHAVACWLRAGRSGWPAVSPRLSP
jgi:hypothetical protein